MSALTGQIDFAREVLGGSSVRVCRDHPQDLGRLLLASHPEWSPDVTAEQRAWLLNLAMGLAAVLFFFVLGNCL